MNTQEILDHIAKSTSNWIGLAVFFKNTHTASPYILISNVKNSTDLYTYINTHNDILNIAGILDGNNIQEIVTQLLIRYSKYSMTTEENIFIPPVRSTGNEYMNFSPELFINDTKYLPTENIIPNTFYINSEENILSPISIQAQTQMSVSASTSESVPSLSLASPLVSIYAPLQDSNAGYTEDINNTILDNLKKLLYSNTETDIKTSTSIDTNFNIKADTNIKAEVDTDIDTSTSANIDIYNISLDKSNLLYNKDISTIKNDDSDAYINLSSIENFMQLTNLSGISLFMNDDINNSMFNNFTLNDINLINSSSLSFADTNFSINFSTDSSIDSSIDADSSLFPNLFSGSFSGVFSDLPSCFSPEQFSEPSSELSFEPSFDLFQDNEVTQDQCQSQAWTKYKIKVENEDIEAETRSEGKNKDEIETKDVSFSENLEKNIVTDNTINDTIDNNLINDNLINNNLVTNTTNSTCIKYNDSLNKEKNKLFIDDMSLNSIYPSFDFSISKSNDIINNNDNLFTKSYKDNYYCNYNKHLRQSNYNDFSIIDNTKIYNKYSYPMFSTNSFRNASTNINNDNTCNSISLKSIYPDMPKNDNKLSREDFSYQKLTKDQLIEILYSMSEEELAELGYQVIPKE